MTELARFCQPGSRVTTSAEATGNRCRAAALRDAMEHLDSLDPRKACIARMRVVGRLSVDQIASCLGLSQATIQREWRFARAWLVREVDD